jgi:hypothetical protein
MMNAKTKVFLAFITIFILGVVAGYFLNNAIQRTGLHFSDRGTEHSTIENRRFWDRGQARNQGDSERRRQWIENHFTSSLNLQEQQRGEFFERISEYNRGIRETIGEQRANEREMLREYYAEFRRDISEILTQEQLEKLDALVHPDSVHHMRMERMRQGRGR